MAIIKSRCSFCGKNKPFKIIDTLTGWRNGDAYYCATHWKERNTRIPRVMSAVRKANKESHPGVVVCSICAHGLQYREKVSEKKSKTAILGENKVQQWLGSLCPFCKVAFCNKCKDSTTVKTCPKCRRPLVPAIRKNLTSAAGIFLKPVSDTLVRKRKVRLEDEMITMRILKLEVIDTKMQIHSLLRKYFNVQSKDNFAPPPHILEAIPKHLKHLADLGFPNTAQKIIDEDLKQAMDKSIVRHINKVYTDSLT